MGPVTVDLLLTLPDDGYTYEVVDGVLLVRMGGSGNRATILGIELAAVLRNYVRPRRLGRVTGADGVYRFPQAETSLIPGAGFYTAERRALTVDEDKPIPFAPDLAVEVVSPSQGADDMAAKVRTYFGGGTRLVWVVWPQSKHIDVWHPDQPERPAHALVVGDDLDGEDVIPGFTYPVADIFADSLA